jgi:hypothetical protein
MVGGASIPSRGCGSVRRVRYLVRMVLLPRSLVRLGGNRRSDPSGACDEYSAGAYSGVGLHQYSTDRLFVVKGLVSLVVFDGRLDSPTGGALNEFKVSERNPGLLVVPPNLYHGWKNIGTDEAFIVNMPSSQYDYDGPDALDLPYESPRAGEIVPFRW